MVMTLQSVKQLRQLSELTVEHLQARAQEKQLTSRTDSLEHQSTLRQSSAITRVTHSQHGSSHLTSAGTSSSSVRQVRASTTVSVTADSCIRLTGERTLTVPRTSMVTSLQTKTDGYTQRSFMTEKLTKVRFTSTVFLTGKAESAHHKETEH